MINSVALAKALEKQGGAANDVREALGWLLDYDVNETLEAFQEMADGYFMSARYTETFAGNVKQQETFYFHYMIVRDSLKALCELSERFGKQAETDGETAQLSAKLAELEGRAKEQDQLLGEKELTIYRLKEKVAELHRN